MPPGAFADAERVADLQRVVRGAVVGERDAVRADRVEPRFARDGADGVAERFADCGVQRADRDRVDLRRRIGGQDRVAQRRVERDRGETLAGHGDVAVARGNVADRDVDAVERRTGDRAGDLHARTPEDAVVRSAARTAASATAARTSRKSVRPW